MPILAEIRELVSATDFQKALSITRSQFDLPRADGYFEPEVEGHDHKPLWDVRRGRKFIDTLLIGAEPICVAMHKRSDIANAAQRLRVRPGHILRLIEQGHIRRIGKHTSRDGYAAILVTIDEMERQLERIEAPGISIEVFARQCGLKPTCAKRLIRCGHTPSTTGRTPKTKAEQALLSASDINAFHARFVILRGLAVERGTAWQALRHTLAEHGIAPFSPDGADYGAICERTDLAPLERSGR